MRHIDRQTEKKTEDTQTKRPRHLERREILIREREREREPYDCGHHT